VKEFSKYISSPEYSKKFFYSEAKNLEIRIKTHQKYSRSKIKWDKWLLEPLKGKEINNVLDLGCGNGRFIFALYKMKIGKSYLGIDISREQIKNAKAEVSKRNLKNAGFKEADVTEIKKIQNKYDLILCNHMLWHIGDLDTFLKDVSSLLTEDGLLLASTNSYDYMREMYDLHSRICRKLKLHAALQKKIRNSKFSLENGKEIFRKRFIKVNKYVLKDELVFEKSKYFLDYYKTFLQPLIKMYKEIPESKWLQVYDEVKLFVERKIESKGKFTVTKNSGYFIAKNK